MGYLARTGTSMVPLLCTSGSVMPTRIKMWQSSKGQHERQLVCCSARDYQIKMYRFVFSSVQAEPRLERILYCIACIDLTCQFSLFRFHFMAVATSICENVTVKHGTSLRQ